MMAQLFVQISVSLDGYIEDANGGLDWFAQDKSADAFATETLRSIDGMVFGKTAHAAIAEFWKNPPPEAESPELPDQARLMESPPKYVLTHGDLDIDWINSHAITLDDLPRIKRETARPIALFAGAAAVRAALGAGVVDELRTIRYPVLLGAGKPLFNDKGTRCELEPVEQREFASGALLSRCRVGT
jgi:dihydrofolate reductase